MISFVALNMKNLFEKTATGEILERIDMLGPNTQGQWGKMDVSQMLAHCALAMEFSLSQEKAPGSFFGRILGRFVKPLLLNEKPFKHNTPTAKAFVVVDARDFEREKQRLSNLVRQYHDGGEHTRVNPHPHPLFGPFSPRTGPGVNTNTWITT